MKDKLQTQYQKEENLKQIHQYLKLMKVVIVQKHHINHIQLVLLMIIIIIMIQIVLNNHSHLILMLIEYP